MLWAPSATQPLLQTQRMLVYVAGVFAALLFTRTGSYRALLAGTWLATTLVSGYSLLTRCFPERLGSIDQLAGYRLSQPLGYWNALGIFSVVGILLALGLAARGRSLVVRALCGGLHAALLHDADLRERHRDAVDWERAEAMLGFGGIRIENNVLITHDGNEVLTADVPLPA
jgi:hypothetical protein